MPEIQQEVLYAMQPETVPTEVAADETPKSLVPGDVPDLSWKNLLDAYTCTECGRCTEACPANQTGKLLSPRKIMMDTRDRMEVLGVPAMAKARMMAKYYCTIILRPKNCAPVPPARPVYKPVRC